MTTRTTSIQPAKQGLFTLIGATAASLAVIGGVALWQVRATSGTATPAAPATISVLRAGVAPLGGLSEQERERQQVIVEVPATRVTSMGGMAELWAERSVAVAPPPAPTIGGMAELYTERAAAAFVAPVTTMGGMTELYAEQQAQRIGG